MIFVTGLEGRTEDGILVILKHAHEMVPFMPPCSGTEDERRALATFFYQLSNGEIEIGPPSRFAPLKVFRKNE